MSPNERVIQQIFAAVDEVNRLLPKEQQLPKDLDTALMGRSGKLDSLGLVNLIVTVEQSIRESLGVNVTLADDRAMSQKTSPFRTLGSLAEYVSRLVEEKANA